jgi:hypothetical protein
LQERTVKTLSHLAEEEIGKKLEVLRADTVLSHNKNNSGNFYFQSSNFKNQDQKASLFAVVCEGGGRRLLLEYQSSSEYKSFDEFIKGTSI